MVDPAAYARIYAEPKHYVPAVVPTPTEPVHDAPPERIPRNIRSLKDWADANGWTTRARRSVGVEISALNGQQKMTPEWTQVPDENTGEMKRKKSGEHPQGPVENVTVKFQRTTDGVTRWAAAIYLGGRFDSGWILTEAGMTSANITLIKEYVKGTVEE